MRKEEIMKVASDYIGVYKYLVGIRITNIEVICLLKGVNKEVVLVEVEKIIQNGLSKIRHKTLSREEYYFVFLNTTDIHKVMHGLYEMLHMCRFGVIEFWMHLAEVVDASMIISDAICSLSDKMTRSVHKCSCSLEEVGKNYMALGGVKSAIEDGRMFCAYQPIVDSKSREVVHYESLFRIIDTAGQVLSIGQFIDILEKCGFTSIIDFIAIKDAIENLKKTRDVVLAVNISRFTAVDDYILSKLVEYLADENVARRMIIEVTETTLMQNFNRAREFLSRLRSLGCRIALDDFGNGYTAFQYIRSLPIDIVKIDGTIIRNITSDKFNQVVAQVAVDLGRVVGAKTVAEFVETEEVAAFISHIGVDYMQGYLFGMPHNVKPWEGK